MNLSSSPLHILLADDDKDDCLFFRKVLKTLPIPTQLSIAEDGEKLMDFLLKNDENLPDILFLDQNMPRKKGNECLLEIKMSPKLEILPVVMYSTYLDENTADIFYQAGAHFYIRKTDLAELKRVIHFVLADLMESKFARPTRDQFIASSQPVFKS